MNYDVVVVGAGPGGLYAANKISEAGLRTVVVEMLHDVYAVCGELTNRHTLDLLGVSTDSEIVSNTIRRTEVVYLDENNKPKITAEIPGKVTGKAYLLNSDLMKAYLKELAESNSVIFKFNSQVTDVIKTNGTIEGIRTSKGDEYRGQVVVAADGANSIVAAKAGMYLTKPSGSPSMKVKLRNCKIVDTDVARFILSKKFDLGYEWDYPRSETEANVGIGSFRPDRMPTNMGNIISEYIKSQPKFDGANVWYKKGDIVPCSGLPSKLSGDHILFIGDSAGQVFNLIGGGVSSTLDGAHMASNAIIEAYELQDFSASILGKYEEKYRKSETGRKIQSTAKTLDAIIRFSESRNIHGYIEEALQKLSPDVINEFVGSGLTLSLLPKLPKLLPALPLVLRIVKDYSVFQLENLLETHLKFR